VNKICTYGAICPDAVGSPLHAGAQIGTRAGGSEARLALQRLASAVHRRAL
jgi:hypothetical protein